ncbi:MAG: hypothetical protein DCC88_04775 [Spirobacillus cienkowskii]|jgi:hypothetical protein|uniref:Uncharacterized protein n=1 Tax=Spirobacillus cienkowskii TaxID=495820 RepID=A0A369KZ19_9BACT|nr:MAG: hypothetical protein DCC88_04775 [Spirobacillus cienkowskii]
MNASKIFKDIYAHLKIIDKSHKTIELLNASINLTSQEEVIAPLQKEFLVIELTYTYLHFGFSIFSNSSIELLIKEMHRVSGTNQKFIKNWLNISSDLILQEISINEKETLIEINILEEVFSQEFVKRIFCSEQDEDYLTGMGIYPFDLIEKIRTISRNKIAKITSKENQIYDDTILESEEYFLDDYPFIKKSIFEHLNQLNSDPLSLLSWRLESFINFIQQDNGMIFLLREINNKKKIDSKKFMAIVSLLVPHSDEHGNLLLPHTPISPVQIARLFYPEFKSDKFQIDILKNWIPLHNEQEIKYEIENILELGVNYGLFFKVPNGNKKFSYGLSDKGLKIIKPFHNVLTDTILKNSIDLSQ